MRLDLQHLMEQATALTRGGRLQEATDVIQRALHGPGSSDGPRTPAPGDVIDVEAREVPTPAEGQGMALPSPTTRREGLPPRSAETPRTDKPAAPAVATTPESFLRGRHGGPGAAGRDYKLYVPPNAGTQPRPLVVMLHGCTQDADDFAAGTRMNALAREHGFLVLYPIQSQQANQQRCWNWFKHTHQQRERGEPALVAGMVREVMAGHAIDGSRIYVAGLSAGGAMAAILGRTHPDLFAAVGVHSGLAAGAARDLPSALEAMKGGAKGVPLPADNAPPTIVFHGSADRTVHPRNGEQVVQPFGPGREEAPQAAAGRRSSTRRVWRDASGEVRAEHWLVQGAPHAWSGGSTTGSYTDPSGPDASAEMLRFFLAHPRRAPG
ncbi:MAG: alpha/beta hydrolase family esterase [Ramlibacter sp.]